MSRILIVLSTPPRRLLWPLRHTGLWAGLFPRPRRTRSPAVCTGLRANLLPRPCRTRSSPDCVLALRVRPRSPAPPMQRASRCHIRRPADCMEPEARLRPDRTRGHRLRLSPRTTTGGRCPPRSQLPSRCTRHPLPRHRPRSRRPPLRLKPARRELPNCSPGAGRGHPAASPRHCRQGASAPTLLPPKGVSPGIPLPRRHPLRSCSA